MQDAGLLGEPAAEGLPLGGGARPGVLTKSCCWRVA